MRPPAEQKPDASPNAWRGSPALRDDVLAQMESHAREACLRPLALQGTEIPIYGWSSGPVRLDLMALHAGLPEALLRLGWEVFDGFPETRAAVRELIENKRVFLALLEPGADLREVVPRMVAWRLECTLERADPSARGVVRDIAAAVELGEHDALRAARPAVDAALAAWLGEIPRQWQSLQRVDPGVYQTVRVLEAAQAACALPDDPVAGTMVMERSIFGANGVDAGDVHAAERAIEARLRELLRDA